MYFKKYILKFCLLALLLLFKSNVFAVEENANTPAKIKQAKIVVSTKPFYNIAQAILGDANTPTLIIKQNGSPHDYSLKLSDIVSLKEADVIIWGGEFVDHFLAKAMENVKKINISDTVAADNNTARSEDGTTTSVAVIPKKFTIDVSQSKNLKKLPVRNNQVKTTISEDDDITDLGQVLSAASEQALDSLEPDNTPFDPHIWLSTKNAIAIAEEIANKLSAKFPDNKDKFMQNLAIFKNDIAKVEREVAAKFLNLKETGFLVFHDAYQYFESEFNLNDLGSIHANPDAKFSAKQLSSLEEHIKKFKVKCIFSEPQFNPLIVNNLSEKLNINYGSLDPLGDSEDIGPKGYITLIRKLADSFSECLGK